MARNGSGSYFLPSPPTPFVNGTLADANGMMTTLQDIAAALTQSVSADGQTPATSNWSLGGHNITNVGNITVANTATFGPMNKLVGGLVRIENDTGIALNVMNNTTLPNGVSMVVRNDRTDGFAIQFQFGPASIVGSITQNGSATAYNTASDHRLKTTYGPAETGAIIDAVPVYDAAFTDQPQGRRPMMLAHELAKAIPSAVIGEKDAVHEDGSPDMQQVNYAALIPAMWGELQALRRRVAALEAR